MDFYVTLFIAVAGFVIGIVLGGIIIIFMLHANENFISRQKRKNAERSRKKRKKKAERKELQKERKQNQKSLRDKITNQNLTYADLLNSVDDEMTEEEMIQTHRRMQDHSYGIVKNRH